ncbi:MAG: hypothetical protein U0X20_11385 [Caldilineaceae bacterium]
MRNSPRAPNKQWRPRPQPNWQRRRVSPWQPALLLLQPEDAPSYDCGGGIYGIGAGLVLHNLAVYNNYGHRQAASPYATEAQSSGYGGGICIVDAPARPVAINHVTVAANVANAWTLGLAAVC